MIFLKFSLLIVYSSISHQWLEIFELGGLLLNFLFNQNYQVDVLIIIVLEGIFGKVEVEIMDDVT